MIASIIEFVHMAPEQSVSRDNHLLPIRTQSDKSLAELGREFKAMYSRTGRPSIPPEQLLKFSRYLHEQE